MEKKNIYREYYRGYGGHIPYKLWVFGMTVDATNNYIKSLLTKEPDYSSTFIPSIKNDYTYYKKDYFNDVELRSKPSKMQGNDARIRSSGAT